MLKREKKIKSKNEIYALTKANFQPRITEN